MRILVVDDEMVVREVTQRWLESFGHEVVSVESGPKALELLEAESFNFDAIITDSEMPEMSGEQLLTRVRGLGFNEPVICISGCSDSELERLRALGFSAVLAKPFRSESLKATVSGFKEI